MQFHKRSIFALIVALALIPALAFADMTVSFINVGQGDAALIQADGETMLIDAGTKSSTDELLYFLEQKGVTHFDLLVCTHPHEDHIGGMDAVLVGYAADAIWMPKAMAETQSFEDVLSSIQEKGMKITAPSPGFTYDLGNAKLTILAPISQTYDDLNNYSIVIRINYGETSFLFVGDAEDVAENELLQSGANLDVDVLKVGHHGSNSSSSSSFLQAVTPKWAVISCGKDNMYGHPHEETLSSLASVGATILRTDINGSIAFVTDGKELTLQGIASYAKTNTNDVNVRASASTKAKKVTTLKTGAIVAILGLVSASGETWYQVEVDGKDGYIRGDLLTAITASEAAVISSNANNSKTNSNDQADDSSDNNSYSRLGDYIGNKNSKKFHLPSCRTLPTEKNRVYFESRDAAISKGYDPCKNCNP